ncbi:outer membrane protein assembly factor BamB [Acinetobacter larvae]|uniref:Outer membrane protein assembly factor BamB n=1 Tax=Acinetobacter larvae TaxID=1789224 RepID=A0A1B2M2A0_9GAMM|nr:outer membrane protein assembly factor BamB [Acinetobacter larvae]AOA59299.1 outer membrane protein assembly factor BamB [Acinetobacter larvae]
MERKYIIPFALAILSAVIAGCSSKKVKEEKIKPNPLPKLAQASSLVPVFSQSVASTSQEDPLRLRMDSDNGVVFLLDPKGSVAAYQGKQRLWSQRVSKIGLSSGVAAAQGLVVVGNHKGQVFAIDQSNGQEKWLAQISGASISPALIQGNRTIVIANDGTVFAFNTETGQQVWTYKLPHAQLSLRGHAAPVALGEENVLISTSNGYVYVIDSLSGVPRMQRRVAVSEGRSDIQRLIDINSDPIVVAQYVVTTSFQGQVTVLDLASQQVVWSENVSSLSGPGVVDNKVFVATTEGELVAYDLLSGQEIWRNNQLLHRNLSNPVAFGRYLVVGDYDGVLHLFDPNSGQLLGRSKTSGDVRSLRVVDGQLFVSTRKGALTAWKTP